MWISWPRFIPATLILLHEKKKKLLPEVAWARPWGPTARHTVSAAQRERRAFLTGLRTGGWFCWSLWALPGRFKPPSQAETWQDVLSTHVPMASTSDRANSTPRRGLRDSVLSRKGPNAPRRGHRPGRARGRARHPAWQGGPRATRTHLGRSPRRGEAENGRRGASRVRPRMASQARGVAWGKRLHQTRERLVRAAMTLAVAIVLPAKQGPNLGSVDASAVCLSRAHKWERLLAL